MLFSFKIENILLAEVNQSIPKSTIDFFYWPDIYVIFTKTHMYLFSHSTLLTRAGKLQTHLIMDKDISQLLPN